MIIKRLVILQAALLLGLSVVFLIPKFHGAQPMGIALALPAQVGDWYGKEGEVTEKEKQVLGADTEFARKSYINLAGDELSVTIVLAGQDVTTSLHQPERCLPAQGWNPVDDRMERVPLKAGTLSSITAKRLHSSKIITLNDGRSVRLFSLDYYWFVGYTEICATPFGRSIIDWQDRIFKGYNQRWAYITIFAGVKGDTPEAQAATDRTIKKFIAELFPIIWKPGGSKG